MRTGQCQCGEIKYKITTQLIWEYVYLDSELIKFSNANQYLYPNEFVGVFSDTQAPTSHDSGSPLLFKDNKQFVVIGTTSSSPNLLSKFQPTAYTKIGTLKNITWIKQIINH